MKKTKLPVLIAIIMAALLIVECITTVMIYKSGVDKQNKLNQTILQQNDAIEQLSADVAELSQTQTVYRLARNIKSGEVLTANDIEQIEVGINFTQGYNTTLEELIGMTTIADYHKGAVLYPQMVYPEELRSDYRTLDVLCDRQPIGFSKGDTVDVRITFPNGQDFLVLTKKLVSDVYGNAVRIVVDEKDILIFKSAEADWARFYKNGTPGTSVQIYCTTYVAAGAQQATSQYYPIQTVLPDGVTWEGSTHWVALNDYNLTDADLSDWLKVDRVDFEKSLEYYDWYRNVKYTWNAEYKVEELNLRDNKMYENIYKATFICPDDEKQIKTEVERAFGKAALDSRKVTMAKYNPEQFVDMDNGALKVNEAKAYKDLMYINAADAYAKRRTAMMEAREKAKAEYTAKYEEGLVSEPWNDSMFDEEKWEQDYASGVLDYLEKLEQEKQKEEDEAAGTGGGSVTIVE